MTRRRLQITLGLLWLLDGILQFQPSMFTATFYGMMLRMGPTEPPGWLWDLGSRVEPVVTAHSALANAAFATVQVLIGVGLLWRRSTRVALAVSVPWALTVWLFGEAAGGLFSPGASALTGAPGAALVYIAVALVLWPRRNDADAAGSVDVRTLPDLAWVALWVGTAALEAEAVNLMPLVAGGTIYNAGNGEPSWLTAVNHAVGGLVGGHGALFAVCAGTAQVAIGLGILARRTRTASLVAGIAIAIFYGVVGQDLGGIFSNGFIGLFGSGATDPGTGPIIVLFALALWPQHKGTRTRTAQLPISLSKNPQITFSSPRSTGPAGLALSGRLARSGLHSSTTRATLRRPTAGTAAHS